MTKEPEIFINGKRLTDAQAMTVRAAINNFTLDLMDSGLGEDEHGREMTRLYLLRLSEINNLLLGELP